MQMNVGLGYYWGIACFRAMRACLSGGGGVRLAAILRQYIDLCGCQRTLVEVLFVSVVGTILVTGSRWHQVTWVVRSLPIHRQLLTTTASLVSISSIGHHQLITWHIDLVTSDEMAPLDVLETMRNVTLVMNDCRQRETTFKIKTEARINYERRDNKDIVHWMTEWSRYSLTYYAAVHWITALFTDG